MLHIPHALMNTLTAHLEAGYPREACGILIGEMDFAEMPPAKHVHDVVLVQNAWDEVNDKESQANRYMISPEDVARADRDAGKRGWDIIGFFHSHPDHPSQASATDREWAWPVISFMITSVRAGKATSTQSWVLRDDRDAFDEEEIQIIASPSP
jgi:proteasome lid subunit RPN8/RPN11